MLESAVTIRRDDCIDFMARAERRRACILLSFASKKTGERQLVEPALSVA
jgi:hypothetical protein